MGDLYTHKWKVQISDSNKPTREFMVWLEALSGKTPDDIARGFKALETKVQKDFEAGKESWPPSYAEFKALCKPYIYEKKKSLALPQVISEEQREANIGRIKDIMKGLKE